MTGNEGHIIAKRQQFFVDGSQQGIVIALGEVRASDGPSEQYIADERQPATPVEEDDMPGGMTGAMDHFKLDLAEGHPVAIFEPAIRRESGSLGKTEQAALLREGLQPECIFTLGAFDGYAEVVCELGSRPYMVEVAMREQYTLDCDCVFAHALQKEVDITARIDQRAATGFLTPNNRTILLKWGNRDNDVTHIDIIPSSRQMRSG